jgi:hypothetical protein
VLPACVPCSMQLVLAIMHVLNGALTRDCLLLVLQASWPCRTPPRHGTGWQTACAQTSPRSQPCCRAAS